ncbi:bifunctional 3-(3-hydroxy-phenyl)propionate/3-hydroxycinnamic acid hydroxylase [Psychrobacillus vulpis]|uniref:Bifunctional 3-(3-hydroxy-phenyl)propionate/3-hydroxycinnamic acid hydroxylase n=1 Tax=Psychrobacillus vulpis TaxID=2325572 RepID=A0A544TLX7_9BACI|nr:bifunctional 3-(3-hydroxy-phenyl)propionate/3-hydroxycinnamic acid hydroxylase [Psychrobacillus vulpis]TQR18428.1 bifunctional 3-(3-hydroxy-phenyl)propionate/3-hydroxycinnamic acid hydroxylase [Psychrobacillus vulpis]
MENPETNSNVYDVAIIGYGPVGATLANMLGKAGKKVVIFEKEGSVYHIPRASHLDGEVMRVYQSIGLAAEMEKITIGAKGYRFLNSKGQLLTELVRREGKGPQGWNYHYRFHQPDYEIALRKGVERFNSVDVKLLHEVVELEQNKDFVTITAKDTKTNSLKKFQALYAVGCDGGRSTVGKMMGASKRDVGLHQPWLVVDIKLKRETELPTTGIQYCEPERPTTFIPYIGDKDRFRWELHVMPGETKEELEKPEKVWKLLSRWVTEEDATIERAAVYTFHSTITNGWRKERLFLAGDAAHQMPPFLGQGMCAGVRDVANLSWKLNMVLNGEADDSLLDTYEVERVNHVKDFINLATELGKIIVTLDPKEAEKRDRRMLEEQKGSAISDPTPRLAGGIHGNAQEPAGVIFPQPKVSNGQLLDDEIDGARFAVIGEEIFINKASSEVKRIWSQVQAKLITNINEEIEEWLVTYNVKCVILRPDRYVLGVANTLEELDAITRLIPVNAEVHNFI